MQQTIIRQYYVLSFMSCAGSLSFMNAIYATYLMRNGLNLFEINMVNATFYTTLFLCEIPTGAFADLFGRKKAFIYACSLLALSMIIYGASSTLTGFTAAEILGAVGKTFRSGAFQAWLVDSLKHQGYTGELNQIFGRSSLVNQIGGAVTAIVSTYASAYNPRLPWFIGGFTMSVCVVMALVMMREDYFEKKTVSWKEGLSAMKDTIKTSVRFGIDHSAVRFVLIATAIQIFSVQALNMFWQPFFSGKGVKEVSYGYIYVLITICIAIGAYVASKLGAERNERKVLLIAQTLTGVLIITASFTPSLSMSLLLFSLHEIPRGMWCPLMDNYLQKRIPDKERATITSFCAIAPHLGGVFGLLISGALAQSSGIPLTWTISGSLLVIGSLSLINKSAAKSNF